MNSHNNYSKRALQRDLEQADKVFFDDPWKEINPEPSTNIKEFRFCTIDCDFRTINKNISHTSKNQGRCKRTGKDVLAGTDLCFVGGNKEIQG